MRTFGIVCIAVAFVTACGGADWLAFRGANTTGVSPDATPPLTFSEAENVAWKSPLPGRGVSGPIVIGQKVFVTAASGVKQDRLHVLCIDAASGKQQWERQFWATGRTLCHPTSSVAANTPASDGERIFAFYSSNDLVCLDLEGNLIWYRGLTHDYPHAGNDVGMASSPVVVGETVVVQIENQGDSFAAGLNTATGETRWRLPRNPQANWTSPTPLRGKSAKPNSVLLQSLSNVVALDAVSGKQLWEHAKAGGGIPSPTVAGEIMFLPGGALTALRYDGSSLAAEVLWENNKLAAASASPVVHQGKVYVLNRAGVLACGDAKDGELLWQLRLKGPMWATPVIVGEHLFAVNQDGIVQVVKLGDKGELVGESPLGESVLASPAASQGALYLRSDAHLWKIARPS